MRIVKGCLKMTAALVSMALGVAGVALMLGGAALVALADKLDEV